MNGFLRNAFFLSLLILLSFWTVKPLFIPGFFPMHDDTQPARVYEMATALSSGQFPVRWVGDLGYGYGYPLFNFYAPLPYYIGAIFNLLGFDALTATKIMFAIGIILAGITMFFFLNNLIGELGALLGSLLYMYAPYHAVDIYVRGAVGEFYAMSFLPLILVGIIKIFKHKDGKYSKLGVMIASLGFAGVLLSHNILGMISAYLFIAGLALYLVYLLIKRKNLSVFCLLLFSFILGLGLSAFFVLPAIFEKDFTKVNELISGGSKFTDHFVYLDQLWASPWGYGGSAPGRADGMSFMLGKIHLVLGLLSVPLVIYFRKLKRINNFQLSTFNFQLILFVVSVFLMLDISTFIWNLIPGFSFIQYPWRFLVFSIFSLSIMVSIMLVSFRKVIQVFIVALLVITVIWFDSKYFKPQEYKSLNAENYTSKYDLSWRISKISDEYLPKDFAVPFYPPNMTWYGLRGKHGLSVTGSQENFTHKKYTVDASNSQDVQTNITYFPGWYAKIDNNAAAIHSQDGRIKLLVPNGQHEVEFIFEDTPIRKFANTISILSFFLLGYIIVSLKIDYGREKKS